MGDYKTDICIFYASEDFDFVKKLYYALSKYWTVWWDKNIRSERFRYAIQKEIEVTDCYITVWSNHSICKDFVLDESDRANKLHKRAFPISLDLKEDVPLGYGQHQHLDFTDWDGNPDASIFQQLLENIEAFCPKKHNSRDAGVTVTKAKPLDTPSFFYSISSHETRLSPEAAMQMLYTYNVRNILLSTYDIYFSERHQRNKLYRLLEKFRNRGAVVFLDSGFYEATRKGNEEWSYENYSSIVKEAPFDFFFSYDETDNLLFPGNVKNVVENVLTRYKQDCTLCNRPVIPILHVPKNQEGLNNISLIPECLYEIAKEVAPPIIAVPERELGNGIFERARTIFKARSALGQLKNYQKLHILGTGDPFAIGIFLLAGADSFDGLEWCKYVFNRENGQFFHFHQFEFVKYQSEYSSSELTRDIQNDPNYPFLTKAIAHNIDFFNEWIVEMTERYRAGKLDIFLNGKLPDDVYKQLECILPEVLT